jgi:hypothetical protein
MFLFICFVYHPSSIVNQFFRNGGIIMSSNAQIKANRQNAQKSTGPKRADGKATVAKNAVKHGLFAIEEVIKGENQADFEHFSEKMLEELNPAGAVEEMLAERIISLGWRLNRVVRIQNQTLDVMIEKDEGRQKRCRAGTGARKGGNQ